MRDLIAKFVNELDDEYGWWQWRFLLAPYAIVSFVTFHVVLWLWVVPYIWWVLTESPGTWGCGAVWKGEEVQDDALIDRCGGKMKMFMGGHYDPYDDEAGEEPDDSKFFPDDKKKDEMIRKYLEQNPARAANK
jgi:hypothetical protein